jgi:hypothetical protein
LLLHNNIKKNKALSDFSASCDFILVLKFADTEKALQRVSHDDFFSFAFWNRESTNVAILVLCILRIVAL